MKVAVKRVHLPRANMVVKDINLKNPNQNPILKNQNLNLNLKKPKKIAEEDKINFSKHNLKIFSFLHYGK